LRSASSIRAAALRRAIRCGADRNETDLDQGDTGSSDLVWAAYVGAACASAGTRTVPFRSLATKGDHEKHACVPDHHDPGRSRSDLSPQLGLGQEVDIVAVDVKKVGQGYRVSGLMGDEVVNDVGEEIGEIDDFIVTRDDHKVFTVLQVGEFLGLGGHLIAVPLDSLEFDGPTGEIVLKGASKEALEQLPIFEYSS
jgi:sporulation protein YlmC with PRC-barrel domain